MESLLIEDEGILKEPRREHRIQINFSQVEEVPGVPAGHGEHGHVRECHRVEEGIHGCLEKLNEGFLHGELFRTVEQGVLQDVEDARAVLRNGLEDDGEQLVVDPVVHPADLCAGLVIDQFYHPAFELIGCADPADRETELLITDIVKHLSCS